MNETQEQMVFVMSRFAEDYARMLTETPERNRLKRETEAAMARGDFPALYGEEGLIKRFARACGRCAIPGESMLFRLKAMKQLSGIADEAGVIAKMQTVIDWLAQTQGGSSFSVAEAVRSARWFIGDYRELVRKLTEKKLNFDKTAAQAVPKSRKGGRSE